MFILNGKKQKDETLSAYRKKSGIRIFHKRINARVFLFGMLTTLTMSLWCQSKLPILANSARPSRATFRETAGFVRVFLNGRGPSWDPQEFFDENGVLLSTQDRGDVILVSGDNLSLARLEFWLPNISQPMNPIVQAGPDQDDTRYSFPCRLPEGGSAIIGWGVLPAGGVCGNRIYSVSQERASERLLTLNHNTKVDKLKSDDIGNNLYAQDILSADGFSVFRGRDLTLVRGYETEGNIVIDVLVGTAIVKDFQYRITEVPAGNRYIYSKQSGDVNYELLNLEEYVESPAMQGYLDPQNWSSGVADVIEQYRIALNLSVDDPVPYVLEQRRLRLQDPGSGGGGGYP